MRIKGLIVAGIACILAATPALSQEEFSESRARRAVFVELLGPTEYASLNLDMLFSDSWTVRGGLQIAGSGRSLGEHYLQLPAAVSRVWFFGRHGVDAGVGLVTTINPQYEWGVLETFFSAGYRAQPLANGIFLRAEALVFPSLEWERRFGVGVGYAF